MELCFAAEMKAADNYAIKTLEIPSLFLMENASGHLGKAALETIGETGRARCAVFCGSGNNGGDGVGAAVWLLERGIEVRVFLTGNRAKITHDTAAMEQRLCEAGGVIEDFDPSCAKWCESCGAVIDAMFGIGLNSELRGAAAEAVGLINSLGVPVIAADIPSGVDADTGLIMGCAVKAARTVTFARAKPGHFVEPGCYYCGSVEVCDIGVPDEAVGKTSVFTVDGGEVRLPKRKADAHKGSFGKLLIIGGSVGYTGAPVLAAQAAVRSGAGLISLGVPSAVYTIAAGKCMEAMPFPLSCDSAGLLDSYALPVILDRCKASDVCLVGPGLGRSPEISELVAELTKRAELPLVIDADGINALSGNIYLTGRGYPTVLTPHEGEFRRLNGDLSRGRLEGARRFAMENGCVTVLKGHRTITAFPDGEAYINLSGNPGMAKGGSGDVLAGMTAALMGQMPLKDAVISAVWLHGKAGDVCAERLGEYAMTPSDIISALCEVMR